MKATTKPEIIDYFVIPEAGSDQLPFLNWLEQMGLIPQYNGAPLILIAADVPGKPIPGDVVVKHANGDVEIMHAADWAAFALPMQ